MNYKEYIPSTALQPFIDSYWVATNYDQDKESSILPDGSIDIIFDLNDDIGCHWKNNIRISGMMTKHRTVISKKNAEILGVRFKTGQFNTISNIALSEIKNKTISASEIVPMFNNSIIEKLRDKNNHVEKLQFLNDFITAKINWSRSNSLELSVCKAIRSNFQELDLIKIAKEHFISLRQLERRFKKIVGVTMKEYHAIIRFNKAIECIATNQNTSLLCIAFDTGYYDHAHLTKEIHRMSGLNPSAL